MRSLRGFVFSAIVATGAVVLPAEKSEAGLIDWLRCVLNPCSWPCDSCGQSCATPSCPAPNVCEGSYCDPCNRCTTAYVRRSYLEPRTRMTTQHVLEPTPTYVRRHYWDPCSLSYKASYEATTSYVRRAYCCPVTDYVERSYLEPVSSCTTPGGEPSSCPTPSDEPSSSPGSTSRRLSQPVVRGPAQPTPNSAGTFFSNPFAPPPTRGTGRPTTKSSSRPVPLAIAGDRQSG